MARAVLRRFRESPRKVRMVADMIRGRSVDDAMSILRLQQRKAAAMLSKVLGSAIANATENEKADVEKLVVSKVVRRRRPRLEEVDAPRDGARHPNPQPHVARDGRSRHRGVKERSHGTEDTSSWFPPRRHPRLELEVVRGEGLHEVAARGPAPQEVREAEAQPRRRRVGRDRARRQQGEGHHLHRAPRHRHRQARRGRRDPQERASRRSPTTRSSSTSRRSARPRRTRSSSPRTSRRSSSAASPSAAP